MTKILYDMETMKFSSFFESFTRSKLKDCFKEGDSLVFVVMPGFAKKAVGPKGINIKKISERLKKPIRVLEFNKDIEKFVRNAIYPVRDVEITQQDSVVRIKCPDTKTKGMVFGREKERLKSLITLVKRYFKITEIIVE